jgi:hypothetical protein
MMPPAFFIFFSRIVGGEPITALRGLNQKKFLTVFGA